MADDGHGDDARAVCREFDGADRGSVVYLRTDRRSSGPAAARNAGVNHAAGEFIYLLDDDDEFLPLHSMQTRIAMLIQRRVYA